MYPMTIGGPGVDPSQAGYLRSQTLRVSDPGTTTIKSSRPHHSPLLDGDSMTTQLVWRLLLVDGGATRRAVLLGLCNERYPPITFDRRWL